jgi:hypothetical protein
MPSSFGLHYSFVIRHSDFVIFPPMTPARFQTIEEIFPCRAGTRAGPVNAFLDTACEGDAVCGVKLKRFWRQINEQAGL